MRELKTYYYIPNIWEKDELDIENAYEFKSNRDIVDSYDGHKYDDFELKWLVEAMADDYISHRDGWEMVSYWQSDTLDFAVWDTDKTFIGKFEVMLEYEPQFTARKKK
jgi:hypothetical protein